MEVEMMVGNDCHSWCNDRSCRLKLAVQTLTIMSSFRANFAAKRPADNGDNVWLYFSVQ